jgi:hypothetical protein
MGSGDSSSSEDLYTKTRGLCHPWVEIWEVVAKAGRPDFSVEVPQVAAGVVNKHLYFVTSPVNCNQDVT